MTNTKKVTENELALVMDSLANAFRKEAEEEHAEMCAKYIEEHGDRLLNPEKYGLLVGFNLEQFNSVLIQNLLNSEAVLHQRNYSRKQEHALEFLYAHYQFIDNHVDKIVEEYEGMPCSADKTRHILQLYRTYLITGKMPVFENEKHYWIPNFGSAERWIGFVKTLSRLYYGHVTEYLDSRNALIQEIEKELEEKKGKQQQYFLGHAYFVSECEAETADGQRYHFLEKGEEGEIQLELGIMENRRNGYILKVDGERARHGIHTEGLAVNLEWVKELIDHL